MIRPLTEDELPAMAPLLAGCFLADTAPHWLDIVRLEFEPGRVLGVFDGAQLVGTGRILTRTVTLPGLLPGPVAAVTSVGVAADHRRRGGLSLIMRTQLHGLHETGGEPIAALWASEGRIYGRYGYGLASQYCQVNLIKGAAFRAGVPMSADPVRELSCEDAGPQLVAVYDKVMPGRIGWFSREQRRWDQWWLDPESERDGMTALRFAVLPDGYVVYRTKADWGDRGPQGRLEVEEVVAATSASYARLCRYLLDMDLVGTIEAKVGVEDPLFHLLAEPMAAVRKHQPALWVRIVDLDRALTARAYRTPVDVVFEISDELCPWNAGRWRLMARTSGPVTVGRTDAAADLAMDIRELAAVFLGGTRLGTLASAGLVRELTPGALASADAAFLGEHEPDCVEVF